MKKYALYLSACAAAVALAACGGGSGSEPATVSGPPVITAQPVSLTVVSGAAASLSVEATGAGLSYQWRQGGVVLSGITAQKFTFSPALAAHAGVYDVIVSNSAGTVTSNTATLTVGVLPAITTQPVALTVAAGGSATFTVAATSTEALTYQWRKAGVNLAGATAASYTIAKVAAADAASYDVVVTNTYGSTASGSVALTVN